MECILWKIIIIILIWFMIVVDQQFQKNKLICKKNYDQVRLKVQYLLKQRFCTLNNCQIFQIFVFKLVNYTNILIREQFTFKRSILYRYTINERTEVQYIKIVCNTHASGIEFGNCHSYCLNSPYQIQQMLSNKTHIGRPNRIDSSSHRSNTPQHSQTQKPQRASHSVSRPIVPVQPVSNVILTPISEQFEKPYYLGKGNNHELIKLVLNRRKGWKEVGGNQFVYFRWVQNSFTFKFHLLGKECVCFNHFQYQRQLSHKSRLVKNLINFCQANKMNAYNFIPVSFILDLNTGQEDLALHAFVKFFNRNYPDQSSSSRRYQSLILPRSKYVPYLTAQQLNKRSQGNFYCKPFCPKSFFDDETKSYLWILKPTFLNRGRGVVLFRQLDQLEKLIWKYYEGEGLEDYGDKYHHSEQKDKDKDKTKYMEYSSVQSIGLDETVKDGFDSVKEKKKQDVEIPSLKKLQKKQSTASQPDKKELFKKTEVSEKKQQPISEKYISTKTAGEEEMVQSTNANTGISSKKQFQQPRCLSFIIQKYIERPMLIEGKKYDIRVWALLTQTLEFYIFPESYLRFSSQPYSTKDSHLNPFIHLTNNSVQKYCSEFDSQSGNQWPLSAIQRYIQPQSKANSIYKSICNKIRQIISLSIYSVRRKINVNCRKQCFELFGYDFMIDEEYKVWLIEVNTNPAIEQASPLLKMLLPRMIDDMFKLTIDKIFNCKMKQGIQEFPVTGYPNDQNMWELLGDLKEGGNLKNDKRLTFARR